MMKKLKKDFCGKFLYFFAAFFDFFVHFATFNLDMISLIVYN